MVVYSIKDLEKLTGIKAHTLRVWEKRYNVIVPKRTDTNIRYYLDEDLKKIMNIALLNRNGYKISKIAQLTNSEIQTLTAEVSDIHKSFENQLDGLTISVLELDEEKFLKIFNTYIHQNGFLSAMQEVIYPLLDKIGMMWMAGSIESVHENFVTHLIKRKCLSEIELLKTKHKSDTSFILFLPEGESGELSVLFLHYLIKSKGNRVINLGVDVEIDSIIGGCKIAKPDYLLTIIDELESPVTYSNYINLLAQHTGDCKIILSGIQTMQQKFSYTEKFLVFHSSEEIITFLDSLNSEPNCPLS